MWLFNPRRKRRKKAHSGRGRRGRGVRRGSCKSVAKRGYLRGLSKGLSSGMREGARKCARAFSAIKGRAAGKRLSSDVSTYAYGPSYHRDLPAVYRKNPRRRRGRSRSRNAFYVPQYAVNPGVSGMLGGVKQAFNLPRITGTLPIVAGIAANAIVSNTLSSYLPVDAVKSGYGRAALKLGTAGVTGALANLIPFTRRYSKAVVLGGVLDGLIAAVTTFGARNPFLQGLNEFIGPTYQMAGGLGCACGPMMGDWLDASALANPVSAPVNDPHLPRGTRLGDMGNGMQFGLNPDAFISKEQVMGDNTGEF